MQAFNACDQCEALKHTQQCHAANSLLTELIIGILNPLLTEWFLVYVDICSSSNVQNHSKISTSKFETVINLNGFHCGFHNGYWTFSILILKMVFDDGGYHVS